MVGSSWPTTWHNQCPNQHPIRDAAQESLYATGMTLTFPVAGAGCNVLWPATMTKMPKEMAIAFSSRILRLRWLRERDDGDGVCDELEVLGHRQFACNFDINATEEDGSCRTTRCVCLRWRQQLMLGLHQPSADNYDPTALVDTVRIISGCTNPAADNYNDQANNDDGSASSAVAPTLMQTTMIPRSSTTMALASSAVAPIPCRQLQLRRQQ